MSNFDITELLTDGRAGGRRGRVGGRTARTEIGRLYRTLLQAGAIKMTINGHFFNIIYTFSFGYNRLLINTVYAIVL